MPLLMLTSSHTAAEGAALSLRLEGYQARPGYRHGASFLIVDCPRSDLDVLVDRIRQADPGSRRVVVW